MTKRILSIKALTDVAGIRVAKLIGQEHTVVPCVALVEGVLWPANAAAPELALAEEFGKFPEGWNGRPVVLNHPVVDGIPVSAAHPSILEDWSMGTVFNAQMDGDKLKVELWINNARVATLGGEFQETLDRLKSGTEMVEVSTGLFMMAKQESGKYGPDAQEYSSVWTNCVPDHIAVLSKGVLGACSVKDGCGAPRVNAMEASVMQPTVNCTCQDKEKTTTASSEPGGYQLPTTANADSEAAKPKKSALRSILELFDFGTSGEIVQNSTATGLSDADIKEAVRLVLQEKYAEEGYHYIVAVYHDDQDRGRIVYEAGWDFDLMSQDFEINAAGVISLGAERTKVRPKTDFVPVEVAGTGQEGAAGVPSTTLNTDGQPQSQPTHADPTPQQEGTKVKDLNEYLAEAPAEIRTVLTASMAVYAAKKNELIAAIKTNKRNTFNDEQLAAMEVPMLEQLAALAGQTENLGQPTPAQGPTTNAEHALEVAPPALVFAPKAAAA